MTETPKDFTLGPWSYNGLSIEALGTDGRISTIATVRGEEFLAEGQSEANACLIAAAPVLLEVLKKVSNAIDFRDNHRTALGREVEQAIAEAERGTR